MVGGIFEEIQPLPELKEEQQHEPEPTSPEPDSPPLSTEFLPQVSPRSFYAR